MDFYMLSSYQWGIENIRRIIERIAHNMHHWNCTLFSVKNKKHNCISIYRTIVFQIYPVLCDGVKNRSVKQDETIDFDLSPSNKVLCHVKLIDTLHLLRLVPVIV